MKLSHQINLFFEYKMADRLILKLEKELEILKDKKGLAWERKREYDEKAKEKWMNKKKQILEEWKLDYSIEEFPLIKKEEIMKYYNHPSRKNDRNPFINFYK